MEEVLDDISTPPSKRIIHIGLILIHGGFILITFILIAIFRIKVNEFIITIIDIDIHILGIVLFAAILINSFWIASIYFKSPKYNASSYLIGLISGSSTFIGNVMYKLALNYFYFINGVTGSGIIPILFNSIILFGLGFLFAKARIKKLRNEKTTTLTLIIILYFFSISLLVKNFGGIVN